LYNLGCETVTKIEEREIHRVNTYCHRCNKRIGTIKTSSYSRDGELYCVNCYAIKDLFDEIKTFNNRYFPQWTNQDETFYSNAMAGEVGEVCNLTKKLNGGGTSGKTPSHDEIIEECADTLIYTIILIQKMGFGASDFKKAIKDKIEKNRTRMEARK